MTASAIQATAPGAPLAVTPAPARRWEVTLRRLAICIALYAIPVSAVVQPVRDWDLWWHLRTGQWIEDNHAVPTTDHFTDYGEGRRWLAYSWLFELLLVELYAHLGLLGILGFRIVIGLTFAFVVHALIARRVRHFLRATLLSGAALFTMAPLLQERSWMFSLLFYALTLDAVLTQRERGGSRIVWLLPVMYALWANLHIQFVNGLFLLGLACAAPVIDRVFRLGVPDDTAATAGSRAWWRLVAVTAACTAATLVNPYHVRLYLTVLELPTQTGAYRLIDELQPLSFRFYTDWVLLGLFAAGVFAIGRRRKLSAFDCLLLGTSAYFAFRARRELWLLALASVAVLVGRRSVPAADRDRFRFTWGRGLVVAAGVVALVAVVGWLRVVLPLPDRSAEHASGPVASLAWLRDVSENHFWEKVAERFPDEAAHFVEEQGYKGRVYNTYDWGGYLMWRLPYLKVAIDGRANLHGDERLRDALLTQDGYPRTQQYPGWDENPDLMNANLCFVPTAASLAQILERDARFKDHCVYKDKVATIFYNPHPPGPRKDEG